MDDTTESARARLDAATAVQAKARADAAQATADADAAQASHGVASGDLVRARATAARAADARYPGPDHDGAARAVTAHEAAAQAAWRALCAARDRQGQLDAIAAAADAAAQTARAAWTELEAAARAAARDRETAERDREEETLVAQLRDVEAERARLRNELATVTGCRDAKRESLAFDCEALAARLEAGALGPYGAIPVFFLTAQKLAEVAAVLRVTARGTHGPHRLSEALAAAEPGAVAAGRDDLLTRQAHRVAAARAAAAR